jgi:hypothetical protein
MEKPFPEFWPERQERIARARIESEKTTAQQAETLRVILQAIAKLVVTRGEFDEQNQLFYMAGQNERIYRDIKLAEDAPIAELLPYAEITLGHMAHDTCCLTIDGVITINQLKKLESELS